MQKRVPILLGLILLCIAVWLYITPIKVIRLLFERFENVGYDLQVRARVLTEKRLTQSAVAIIDLDDHSLTVEGQWPWPRSKLANLVLELKKQGVAVVAFDMLFAESQRNSAQIVAEELAKQGMLTPATAAELDKGKAFFDDDGIFSTALSQIDSVLALGFLNKKSENNLLPPPLLTLSDPQSQSLLINHAEGYIGNLPSLQKAAKGAGFINIYPDNDGIIRRAPLIIEYQHQIYPSLALQAAMLFLSEKVHLKTANYSDQLKLEGIQLGNITIPTDEQGQLLIPFFGHSYTFPYYSATDVLHGRIPANALLGKIVFLGTSATGLGDLKATAVQNPFPGVEIQASIVNGILQQHFSYQPAWTYGANLLFIIVTGVLCSFLFPYLGPKSLAAIIVLVPPTIMSFNYWLRNEYGLILSFLIPNLLIFTSVLLNIIYGYLFENRRREKLKAMFGQYVPAKHIDEMLQKHSDYALRGEDREMSVLFADIRNFTSISEGMSATNLVDMLNTFFTPMTEIIFNHHGTIDKYVGDLIMAFWGAPLKDEQHASHALESALEMRAKIQSLQPMLAEKKWPAIQVGIGINSGVMSVGDMGSKYRRNYTVLGDAVNLASRVEGLTKFYGVSIITTEYTQANQANFVFRPLDKVRVKGKKNSIMVYELLCHQQDLTDALKAELDHYQEGLDAYYQQQWPHAEKIFNELKQQYPDTKIYSIYVERIKEYQHEPLPADWDGVYTHHSK